MFNHKKHKPQTHQRASSVTITFLHICIFFDSCDGFYFPINVLLFPIKTMFTSKLVLIMSETRNCKGIQIWYGMQKFSIFHPRFMVEIWVITTCYKTCVNLFSFTTIHSWDYFNDWKVILTVWKIFSSCKDFRVVHVCEEKEGGKHPVQNQNVVSKIQISWEVKYLANCRDKKFGVNKHADKILS